MAHRIHTARLCAGIDDEETEEASAGALLEAYTAAEVQGLNAMGQSYIEALNRSGSRG